MHQSPQQESDMRLSALYIHPVKSLAGIAVDSFRLTDRGPEHDRRWMLVDHSGRFLTQRVHPRMALLTTAIQGDRLVISDRRHPDEGVEVPIRPTVGEELRVGIWEDECEAIHPSPEASEGLSKRLGVPVRLVYMPDGSRRPVDPDFARQGEITSFSDGYPLLIIGQSSLDDLNERLDSPVAMERFRPNLVFSGGAPYAEDGLRRFTIAGIRFHGVKPCARCVLTTVDPLTAETGSEPLRTLSTYRTLGGKVLFGMNLLHEGDGVLRVGDALAI
jgi:uncharacterized protein YcbX